MRGLSVARPDERPPEVLERVGRWFAEQLEGFSWVKSRKELRRQDGSLTLTIHLQPNRYSRAGVATWASPRVMVTDSVHQDWQRTAKATQARFVYNTLLVNISTRWVDVECSGLSPQPEGSLALPVSDFLADLRHAVIPTLELFQDPASIGRTLPDAWLRMVDAGTVEWALAHGQDESARLLIQRSMSQPLKGKHMFDPRPEAFRKGWNASDWNREWAFAATVAFGWLSREHALLTPEDLPVVEPQMPSSSPQPGQEESNSAAWWRRRR